MNQQATILLRFSQFLSQFTCLKGGNLKLKLILSPTKRLGMNKEAAKVQSQSY